jgi:hypothetical protein
MKVAIYILSLAIVGCYATQWQDIKSPMDSPHYREIVDKLLLNPNDEAPVGKPRITNGSPATLGQFPYQVYMYLYDVVGNGYLCGGSVKKQ